MSVNPVQKLNFSVHTIDAPNATTLGVAPKVYRYEYCIDKLRGKEVVKFFLEDRLVAVTEKYSYDFRRSDNSYFIYSPTGTVNTGSYLCEYVDDIGLASILASYPDQCLISNELYNTDNPIDVRMRSLIKKLDNMPIRVATINLSGNNYAHSISKLKEMGLQIGVKIVDTELTPTSRYYVIMLSLIANTSRSVRYLVKDVNRIPIMFYPYTFN